jgi:hypothetical protein
MGWLDRTIGFGELVLTGVVRPMVRSSRTMTMKGGRHAARRAILTRMWLGSIPIGREIIWRYLLDA